MVVSVASLVFDRTLVVWLVGLILSFRVALSVVVALRSCGGPIHTLRLHVIKLPAGGDMVGLVSAFTSMDALPLQVLVAVPSWQTCGPALRQVSRRPW